MLTPIKLDVLIFPMKNDFYLLRNNKLNSDLVEN